MTNKNTRRAFLASLMALILCVSSLLGTTYAWFTDSVTSSNNIIKSGNLDVELEYWNGTKWEDVNGADDILTNTLWEPGVTEVAYLRVANAGSLALKYQLGINIVSETAGKNKAGEEFKLSDYIQFGVVEGVNGKEAAYANREAAVAAVTGAKKISAGYTKADSMTAGKELYLALVVWMPTDIGNVANHDGTNVPEIKLGFNVFATQMASEEDSFNGQYDKDAWHPDFTVISVENLATALASGGKIQVNGTLNAGATQDVPNWTNAPAEFIFDATTLDALKGGKYVLEQGSRYGVVGLISAGESLALSDMEITANSQWPVYLSNYGGTLTLEDINVTATQGAGIYPYGTKGTTTIKSATVNQKALSDEFASSTPWAGTAIATSNGHNLIIEDGTYIGSTWGVYVYNSGANVTINGGTFKAPKVIQADGVWSTGGNKSVVTINDGNFDGALYLDWGTTPPEIYINGGNFTNFSATVNGAAKLVIKGGTFDKDPSAYVAPGYQVTNNGDGTYTVGAYKISTGAELVDAIANGKAVELTQDVQIGKIDLTGAITNDVVIDANGHKITTTDSYGIEVTPGKNVTISNADVEMTKEGNYITYAAGFKIANGDYAGATITLENCTITMANTDWAYAVTMPAFVKNLNLVIDNCTLEGAVAVQCWGDNNTITITDSKLICNYTTNALYTSYCVALQGDGTNNSENNTLVIDNCEFLYSGIDNFNSSIYSAKDVCKGNTGNTVTVTNCTYGEKVAAN